MTGTEQLEKDVKCMNECAGCPNFNPFQRVMLEHRADLYKRLAEGDATDTVQMQVTQRTLKIVEDILSAPAELQRRIDRVCEMRELKGNKVSNIQRKREINV